MSNELVKQEATLPATQMQETMSQMGIEASDIVIPKLLLMQNTSEYVGDGKAKLGDIVNSSTHEVLGGIDSPVELVPLKLYKTWRIYDMSSKSPQFMRQENVTAENRGLPWEDNENGKPIRRDLCMNFFVLIKKYIETGSDYPLAVLTFKRTGIQAGQQLATHMFLRAQLKQLPHSMTVMLKVKKDKFETNTYSVFEIGKGMKSDNNCLVAASEALTLLGGSYKVDEVSEEREAKVMKPAVMTGNKDDIGF